MTTPRRARPRDRPPGGERESMSKLTEKMKALGAAMCAIEKQYGKGSIMRLGEEGDAPPIAVVSSGSIGLDLALGVGGYPRGRVIEIFGPESSGKTTLEIGRASC